MKICSKEYMEEFFENHSIFPFELEEINDGIYAAKTELTFTSKPFMDEIFVQSVIIDDSITSVCAVYTEVEDTDRFDELADLFVDKYSVQVRYDDRYKAIKANMSVNNDFFDDDEMNNDELLIYVLTLPDLICRMAAYAYFAFEDDKRSAEEIFEEVTEDEDFFLCPDFINYDVENNSAIAEGMERYFTEHIFLPEMFYNEPHRFIDCIINEPKFLESLIERFLDDNDAAMIPGYETLNYEMILQNDACIAIDIQLPKAEKTNDCTDIILFCSESNGTNYYTVELDIDNGKTQYHSCAWDDNRGHSNYGYSKTRDGAIKIITDLISHCS